MKIIILRDYYSFPWSSLAKEESISVLDYIGIRDIDKSISNKIIHPLSFTSEEKEMIVDEYIETMSDIGSLNNYSLYWLCHPISEKNDLIQNNLLSQIVDFLSFSTEFFSVFQKEKLVILTCNNALSKNIIDFCKEHNIDYVFWGTNEQKSFLSVSKSFLKVPKSFVSGLFYEFRHFRNKLYRYRKSRCFLKRLNKRVSYTVIRTWFDHRSKPLINQDMDVYFGRLLGDLKVKGENILLFGGIVDSYLNFDAISSNLKGNLRNPVVLYYALLNPIDYLKAIVFRFNCKHKIRLPNRIAIQGIDLGFVFKNYFHSKSNSSSIDYNFLSYLAVKKLLKKVRVNQFFNLFENYAWEKVTTLAISKSSKKIKLKAFQHAQVALSSTKFFLGEKESQFTPLPDKIITLGRITRDFLVTEKNYPEDITVPGCALRQDYQNVDKHVRRKNPNRILVCLWTFERSIEMLNLLHESKLPKDRYRVTVCPHPNDPFDKLKPHLNFNDYTTFKISNEPLKNNLKIADIVLYSGTTTCLDALSFGLPVVNVEFDDFISPDPLFLFDDFKWTVKRPGELVSALESICKLTDDEYYSRQTKAFDFVREYFYPVNNENLKVFLD